MDELLLGPHYSQAHLQVVQRIGDFDHRLDVLQMFWTATKPIWISHNKSTEILLHRLGKSLCPEMIERQVTED